MKLKGREKRKKRKINFLIGEKEGEKSKPNETYAR